MIRNTHNAAFFADVATGCLHGEVPDTEVYRAPTVGMPDAHDSLGSGNYRARALPGAE